MIKKNFTLKYADERYKLIRKDREGNIVRYQVSENVVLEFEEPLSEITLDHLAATLEDPVDNTWNTRTWPSEELLAHYIIENLEALVLNNKRKFSIYELGARISGLAGFVLVAKYPERIERVEISDGNA
jgi:hypothetical protein